MNLRIFSLALLFCTLAYNTHSVVAQTTPLRRVYWLHDINEDNIDATLAAPNSFFWLNYAGTSRTTEDDCATQGEGYFRSTYKMAPALLSYYSDRPVPAGKYSIFLNDGTPLTRTKIGNSLSATATRTQIQATMDQPDPEIVKPFIIAQGAGAALALDIQRNDGSQGLIGGIISIGGAHRGIPLINSVSSGKLDDFDKYMKKSFSAGYEKYAEKVEAKIFTTLISLGLGFISTGAGEGIKDKVLKTVIKFLDKLNIKLSGLVLSEAIKAGIKFEGPLDRSYPGIENDYPPYDPIIFNGYIKSAYSKTIRPLLVDLEAGSPWSNANSITTPTIPVVSINGRYEKSSYFQVMQTARWKVHTKNRCLDLKVEQMVPLVTNAPVPILVKRTVDITKDHENLGELTKASYVQSFQGISEHFKSNYMAISALCESAKFVQTVALGAKEPISAVVSTLVGLGFGVVGMIQADQTGNEIMSGFEKGEKWIKNESDPAWAKVIGATKEITITVTRPTYPNGRFITDENGVGSANQMVLGTFTFPQTVVLPNDGIVGGATQESPQERNWTSGNSTSGLNLEANKVDHFSQANHPRIRERIEATIQAQTSQSNLKIREAFFVNK